MTSARRCVRVVALATAVGLAACTGDDTRVATPSSGSSPSDGVRTEAGAPVAVSTLDGEGCPGDTEGADFPDVVGATFTPVEGESGTYEVAVTLCSRYDTADRYADAWRVTTPDGAVLGTRELLHDHAAEQPFTRSLGGSLTLPDGSTSVVVEGRDLANGWGGTTLAVDLDGA